MELRSFGESVGIELGNHVYSFEDFHENQIEVVILNDISQSVDSLSLCNLELFLLLFFIEFSVCLDLNDLCI